MQILSIGFIAMYAHLLHMLQPFPTFNYDDAKMASGSSIKSVHIGILANTLSSNTGDIADIERRSWQEAEDDRRIRNGSVISESSAVPIELDTNEQYLRRSLLTFHQDHGSCASSSCSHTSPRIETSFGRCGLPATSKIGSASSTGTRERTRRVGPYPWQASRGHCFRTRMHGRRARRPTQIGASMSLRIYTVRIRRRWR